MKSTTIQQTRVKEKVQQTRVKEKESELEQSLYMSSSALVILPTSSSAPVTETNPQVIRRFYHIREEKPTSEYELACEIKKYLLEERKTASLINDTQRASSSTCLEEVVTLYPDIGKFSVLEQEHHDVASKALFGSNYNRDHFLLIEGTGEEVGRVEEFFSLKGYRLIEAKTCTPQQNLRSLMGNIEPFHREEMPGFYDKVKKHFRRNSETYSVLGGLSVILSVIYLLTVGIRVLIDSGESPNPRGAITIIKEDIFGRGKSVDKKNQPYTICK